MSADNLDLDDLTEDEILSYADLQESNAIERYMDG
jgi:hypothetical protein